MVVVEKYIFQGFVGGSIASSLLPHATGEKEADTFSTLQIGTGFAMRSMPDPIRAVPTNAATAQSGQLQATAICSPHGLHPRAKGASGQVTASLARRRRVIRPWAVAALSAGRERRAASRVVSEPLSTPALVQPGSIRGFRYRCRRHRGWPTWPKKYRCTKPEPTDLH